MENVLSRIPGLAGYTAQSNMNRQQDMGQVQQVSGLQAIFAQAQKQQMQQKELAEAEQLKGVLSQTGGDPAKAIQALMQAGTPKSLALAAQLKAFAPKPAEPYTLAPGAQRFGVNNEMLAEAPMRPDKAQNASNLSRLMAEMSALPPGDPARAAYQNAIRKESETARQITPVTNIHNPAPVTPVTIQDPNDPSKTIIIDGRTRQKLGDGPKLTQTGAADQKLAIGLPQAKLRVMSMTQNLDRLDTAMSELDADPGLPNITGTVMGRTPNMTNAATGAQAKLKSITSQIFQSSLQAMREASKTGGAVGNVSDREGDKLERTIAALDQSQSTESFKKQLQKARQQVKLSKELINTAFQEQYGNASTSVPTGRPPLDSFQK